MLIDELQDQLKSAEPELGAITKFYNNANLEERFQELEQTINEENFWKHPDQISISKAHQRIKLLKQTYAELTTSHTESLELIDLFAQAPSELENLKKDIGQLVKKIKKFKIELLLNQPNDANHCFVSINAGAGGTESQDWTGMLLRMFLRFCERENLKAAILDYQSGEEAGVKSATLFIKGANAYGFLKAEHGIHRLVRISPFDSSKRRHTSFAAVFVTSEVPDAKVEIKDDDLRIDTYRAGGAGGQHVNKTDSAVRITHLPTKIVVQCQNERSQLQNKQTAMKMLMAKLIERKEEEKRAKKASIEKKKIEWGSQIRSYVLHPYKMVKDHRTSHESPQPDLVLDGELMPFIESYLLLQAAEPIAQTNSVEQAE